MTMGENPAYRLRGVEVKEVSHRPPNPIKHNPAEISTAPIMKNTCDVDYHGIEEASTSIMSFLSPLGQNLYDLKDLWDQLKTRFHVPGHDAAIALQQLWRHVACLRAWHCGGQP